jgi:glycosyltransferase involved in cell wall biosynthesis
MTALRLGVDASVLQPVRTGVGNYVFNLLDAYRRARPDAQITLFSHEAIASDARPFGKCVEFVGTPIKKGPLWLSSGLLPALHRNPVDVFWGGNGFLPLVVPRGTKRVVTIHDFVYLHAARTIGFVSRTSRRWLQPAAIRQADARICVSHSTAQEMRTLCGREADAIIEPRIDPVYRRATEAEMARVRTEYDLPPRFLLSVGTLEPRKNVAALLSAHARVRAAGVPVPPLVLAGKTGWLADDIATAVAEGTATGGVRALGYVPLADMPALYTAAEAFVFVPLYEGFGMPLREALRCGTPVLASDIGALREAARGAAWLVAPDESSIAAALCDYATGARRPPPVSAEAGDSDETAAVKFAEVIEGVVASRYTDRA